MLPRILTKPLHIRLCDAGRPPIGRRHFLAQLAGSGLLLAVRNARPEDRVGGTAVMRSPRIVNIYNFVRNSDPRVTNSEDFLFAATARQLQLLRHLNLPCTFALQYDALINPRYQQLFKTAPTTRTEIGAWLEVPRALVEKAGLPWRGPTNWAWDWNVDVDFTIGYAPDERIRIVDAYMTEFKRVFGRFPATVGAWYVDEITLAHLAQGYGIVASCNCKDQAATDGYTLWGGYWNQAYYPSRLNAYMPAQHRAAQIDVPIFRMLGSDPIYQYQSGLGGNGQGVMTLEPSSPGGRSKRWVNWFFKVISQEPCLAFAYAQAGQENSFGWSAMRQGVEYQFPMIARLARAGIIQVETLEQSGRWFRKSFDVTPATAVVAMHDWQHQGRKTVWYDTRHFRVNFYWHGSSFRVRDIHLFNENVVSPYHEHTDRIRSMAVYTLPIVDGFLWSSNRPNGPQAGIRLVAMDAKGIRVPLAMDGNPAVTALHDRDLHIRFKIRQGGTINIVCREDQLAFNLQRASGSTVKWAMEMTWSTARRTGIGRNTINKLYYNNQGVNYALALEKGTVVRPGAAPRTVLFMPQQDAVVMALKARLIR
ncbi:MAG: hypothetical protein ACP5I8_12845 [Phycisphaerae bacterium]